MSRRAKIFVPLNIKLEYNAKTSLYEGKENGVLYNLTFAQMNDFKIFSSGRGYKATFIAWYNSLNHYEKKNVQVIGKRPEGDDFIPDPEWLE